MISKRLQAERYKSFWHSNALRSGNTTSRLAWITQRINEQSAIKLVNPYMEREVR